MLSRFEWYRRKQFKKALAEYEREDRKVEARKNLTPCDCFDCTGKTIHAASISSRSISTSKISSNSIRTSSFEQERMFKANINRNPPTIRRPAEVESITYEYDPVNLVAREIKKDDVPDETKYIIRRVHIKEASLEALSLADDPNYISRSGQSSRLIKR